MPPTAAKPRDEYDAELLKRLDHVVHGTSQADVSRRTGASQPNINRYLKGMKMPASFCSALIDGCGVNPSWLLTGQGPPYLTDLVADAAMSGANLMELVQAMQAVTQKAVGALTSGKDGAVRQFNRILADYQALRTQLHDYVRPVLERLLKEFSDAVGKRNDEAADQFRKTISQLLDISGDPKLELEFISLQGSLEFNRGNAARAIELQRETVRRYFADPSVNPTTLLQECNNLVVSLRSRKKVAEAARLSRSVLTLLQQHRELEMYAKLMTEYGLLTLELGNLTRGYPIALKAYNRLQPGEVKDYVRSRIVASQLWAGAITFDEQLTLDKGVWDRMNAIAHGFQFSTMLNFAGWLEDADVIHRTLRFYGAEAAQGGSADIARTVHCLECLQGGLEGNLAAPHLEYARRAGFESVRGRTPGMHALVSLCQLARIGGDEVAARQYLVKAAALFDAAARDETQYIRVRALHSRNVLLLAGDGASMANKDAMCAKARAYLRRLYSKGFAALRADAMR